PARRLGPPPPPLPPLRRRCAHEHGSQALRRRVGHRAVPERGALHCAVPGFDPRERLSPRAARGAGRGRSERRSHAGDSRRLRLPTADHPRPGQSPAHPASRPEHRHPSEPGRDPATHGRPRRLPAELHQRTRRRPCANRRRQRRGRILLSPNVVSHYFARDSLSQVARMYYQYGYSKPLVARKVGAVMTARQLVPPAFVLLLAATAALSPWVGLAGLLLGATAAAYLLVVLA